MNNHFNEKNEKEKLYSIDEMEELMITENRKKAEPILQKISDWLGNQENLRVEDTLIHPILVIPIKGRYSKYYMQVLLDHNNIKIAAAIKFDSRNRRRISDIVDEINANVDESHLGYAHAYIPRISSDLYISYMYEFDFSNPDTFDPEKHFAKYWFSITGIVEHYYNDIIELPSYYDMDSSSKPHGSIMDKFLATIQDDDGSLDELRPYGPNPKGHT